MAEKTKTLVWTGYVGEDEPRKNHARRITPEDNGTSQEYFFAPMTGYEVVVDEADAAVLLSGPTKDEFRFKA